LYYHENRQNQRDPRFMDSQFYPGRYPEPGSQGYPNQGNYPSYQGLGAPYGMNQRQILIEDAIQIARAQVPGEVVSAELERRQGRLIYEIDIVSTEGPVYEVKADQMTGEILEIELD